ncbi:MAG TPA: hypothetical protein VES40_00920 [Ilumatobacteraceae bacterium]|nr:hypothetical protein [Ilumatobacteraceae bacterium]
MTIIDTPDPAQLPLAELRGLRQQLQHEDDAVSYARRVAQARLDLVKSEARRREDESDADSTDDLRTVLSQHLTGGPARPPRPTEDLSDHPLALELDEICAQGGLGHVKSLDDAELEALTEAISDFETRMSSDRRERFDRLDALSAELVRRYRDGEADVDTLLAEG